jgi:hypothetical protein
MKAACQVALALLLGASCGGSSATGPTATPTPVPTPEPAPTPASPTARYRVTFEATWSAETHPTDIPETPHFSRLIGGTHSDRAVFWEPGATASAGIEAMAELGATSPLDAEIQAAIAAGTAEGLIEGGGISLSPSRVSVEFQIGRDHPLVTLVSMIAPSPDWFVGVHGLSLVEGGDWVEEKTVMLAPYDAGTDDGSTYRSPDSDTMPREPIQEIEGPPLASGGVVAPLGTFTFVRLSS